MESVSLATCLLLLALTVMDPACSTSPTDGLSSSINDFSFDLHRLLAAEKNNVIYSPLGLTAALAMLYLGACDETEVEMRKVLRYNTHGIEHEDVPVAYRQLLNNLDGVHVANAALLNESFHMVPQYKDDLRNFFNALATKMDFTNQPQEVQKYINNWVKNKTRGHIEKFLDSVNPQTVLMLLNTVYFEGKWEQRFFPRENGIFYNNGLESQARNVSMMGRVSFSNMVSMPGNYSVLELQYKETGISMWILLPNQRDGLPKLEQNLRESMVRQINESLSKSNRRLLRITMPKFKMGFKREMNGVLAAMGMKIIFDNRANFTGISEDDNIKVSKILHESKIEVDELGTIAASSTSVELVPLTYPFEVDVDHPFLFWIIDQRNLTILFTGRVAIL